MPSFVPKYGRIALLLPLLFIVLVTTGFLPPFPLNTLTQQTSEPRALAAEAYPGHASEHLLQNLLPEKTGQLTTAPLLQPDMAAWPSYFAAPATAPAHNTYLAGSIPAKNVLSDLIAIPHSRFLKHSQHQWVLPSDIDQPQYSLLLVTLVWTAIVLCIGINYLIHRSKERASFLILSTALALLCTLPPTGMIQQLPDWLQLPLLIVLCCAVIYFLCRLTELWLAENRHYSKRCTGVLHTLKSLLPVIIIISLPLNILLPVAPCAALSIITPILAIAPALMLVICIRCCRPFNLQVLLLAAAVLCVTLLLFSIGLAPCQSSEDVLFLQEGAALLATALLSLAIAIRNYNQRLQEGQRQSRKVSDLEQKNEDLRDSLFRLSSRLRTDSSNHNSMLRLLSHDLRSPIASLQTFANIIIEKDGKLPPAELNAIAKDIHRTCSLQLELLHNLLSLSRGTAPGIPPRPSTVQLEPLVMRAWNNVADLAHRKQIELVRNIPKGLQTFIDQDALQTILRNLLTNAIKFSHPQSTIHIGVRRKSSSALILSIKDNGIGISSQRQQRLFDDELNSTRGTLGEKGIGIGLRLCNDLASANNCTLRLRSSIGEGTTVELVIPAVSAAAKVARADVPHQVLQDASVRDEALQK